MEAEVYQAGVEVEEEAMVRAFTSCFSQAEIVDEVDVRLVFGDLSRYSDQLVLQLCQRLVAVIQRDWANDKNSIRIQQQFMTNRTEAQAQQETVRAYQAVVNLLDERLKNGGKSIQLTVTLAGAYFDLAEYRRKKNLSTPEEHAKLRNEAFASLRDCAKLYEEMLRERKAEYTVSPFSNWFSIILGASQLQNLKVTAAISDAYLDELKEQLNGMDDEWRERHYDMLGQWMQKTWPTLQPHVKLPFMESALYVLDDHHSLAGMKKQMDFYQSLLTEVELNLEIDGASDVGHVNEFGIFISLHHSRELGREAGGFDKYAMSNVNVNGRGVVDYRKRFSEQLNKVLKDKFELGSLTWLQSRPKPMDISKTHWQKTPLAYMTLRALDPAIDKIPEINIEMDFNDGHGQVVLPVASNVLLINAESANYLARPNKDTKVEMILDSRGAAEGKVSLELEIKGQGLMPDLGSFLKVPAEYKLDLKKAQPMVSRYEQDGDELIVYSELSLDIPVKWQGKIEKFTFPELDYEVAEIAHKKYRDADIVVAEKTEYIKAVAARSPAVYVAIVLFVILLGIGGLFFSGKSAGGAELVESKIIDPPERVSPVSVAAWLQELADAGVDQEQAMEDKQNIEQSYFSEGDSVDIDLGSIVKKWCDKQKRG